MASEAAKAVAREVLETVGKGQKPNISKIGPKHGYSKKSASQGRIVQTKSYKEAIRPVIEQLEIERDRAIKMMKGKISKAKYRDLVDSADKLTKNIQLLNGGKTSSDEVKISWE